MKPKSSSAGMAGILTGLALVGEFAFFMMSGYNPQSLNDPASALIFLQENSGDIRIAVLFGAVGVALRMLFVSGLAANLHAKTPTQAVATLYFGILGSTGHGLVALSFYMGIPALLSIAITNPASAKNAWSAYTTIMSGFEGFGNFLIGLMLLTAGWAIISKKAMSKALGWVGFFAGLITLARVFTTGTPLAGLAFTFFFPSLFLAVLFDIWAGIALWRNGEKDPWHTTERMQLQAE